MKLIVDIPDKEFGIEIEDKFQDFFKKLEVEIKKHMISGTNLLCGAYELETIQMLMQALAKGIPLPEGHGRLIDENELLEMTKSYKSELGRLKADPFVKSGIETVESFINDLPTIIEADE